MLVQEADCQFYEKGNLLMEDLIKLALLQISFRYMNGTLPMRIINLFNISDHDYYTRNRNNLRAPQHNIEKYNKSFLGQAPHLWLHLIDRLKTEKSCIIIC